METVEGIMEETLENHLVDTDVDLNGSELFDMLVALTAGEALTIVRGTEAMNGYLPWKRLCERFNPNTPAKASALMMDVMKPKPASERAGFPRPSTHGT